MIRDGIILLDKRAGLSSAKALARVKSRLSLEKIGHSGTLDPFATGLLVCLIGRATRLARFAEEGRKQYRATITLGVRSSTDDCTGELFERSGTIPAEADVHAAINQFRGEIDQVPPQISAVKVNGERSYRRARRGEVVELKSRRVTVYRLELSRSDDANYEAVIECSAGTYIRSIARDLGAALGCGGVLSALRREYSHPFSVSDAKEEEQLSIDDIRPWTMLFPQTPRIVLPHADVQRLSSGDQSILGSIAATQEFDRISGNKGCVMYVDAASDLAGGVLEQVGARWVLGVHFGHGG